MSELFYRMMLVEQEKLEMQKTVISISGVILYTVYILVPLLLLFTVMALLELSENHLLFLLESAEMFSYAHV